MRKRTCAAYSSCVYVRGSACGVCGCVLVMQPLAGVCLLCNNTCEGVKTEPVLCRQPISHGIMHAGHALQACHLHVRVLGQCTQQTNPQDVNSVTDKGTHAMSWRPDNHHVQGVHSTVA